MIYLENIEYTTQFEPVPRKSSIKYLESAENHFHSYLHFTNFEKIRSHDVYSQRKFHISQIDTLRQNPDSLAHRTQLCLKKWNIYDNDEERSESLKFQPRKKLSTMG